MAKRILIVDDDPGIRDVLSLALDDEGYDSLSVAHGIAALAAMPTYRPHMILLDLRMPLMNGQEFVAAYHQQPGPHVPILVMTASRDALRDAANLPVAACLAKPFKLDIVMPLIERYTANNRDTPASM